MLHFGFKDTNVVGNTKKKNTYTSETILIIHARLELGQKEEWGLKLEMEVWKPGSQNRKCGWVVLSCDLTRQQDRWDFNPIARFSDGQNMTGPIRALPGERERRSYRRQHLLTGVPPLSPRVWLRLMRGAKV